MQTRILVALALGQSLIFAASAQEATSWKLYPIAESGASIEIPVSLFSEPARLPADEIGQRYFTRDHRANLTVRRVPNPGNDTPAAFLSSMRPPSEIAYKRVTSNFFVVSSFRDGMIWYDRCNRSTGYMNCVLINYPASEKRQWDDIVTRISNSLRP